MLPSFYKYGIDDLMMDIVKISPKFQVVIPKKTRAALRLRAGQALQVIEYADRIELIPEREISSMRGFLKGIDTNFEREDDRL